MTLRELRLNHIQVQVSTRLMAITRELRSRIQHTIKSNEQHLQPNRNTLAPVGEPQTTYAAPCPLKRVRHDCNERGTQRSLELEVARRR
eukprot:6205630-Pleurochrysis_carterae.AAC.3